MAADTIGVAVLGAGFIAEYHLAGIAAAGGSDDASVHPVVRVIAARSTERAAPLAARFAIPDTVTDWREALARDDVDAVVICTPDDTHEQIAIAAAEAGKAVLLQKPMAGTVAACERIIAAAERAGIDLQVSFMHRYFPEVLEARRLLGEGAIGRVHSVRLRNATPGPDWGEWFFFGALLSAIMSTASATLLAPSTTFVENVLKNFVKMSDKQELRYMRVTVVVFTACVLAYSIIMEGTPIYELVSKAYQFPVVGAFWPLVCGLYWRRSTRQGAIWSIVLGMSTWALLEWTPLGEVFPSVLGGFLLGAVGMFTGSLAPTAGNHAYRAHTARHGEHSHAHR